MVQKYSCWLTDHGFPRCLLPRPWKTYAFVEIYASSLASGGGFIMTSLNAPRVMYLCVSRCEMNGWRVASQSHLLDDQKHQQQQHCAEVASGSTYHCEGDVTDGWSASMTINSANLCRQGRYTVARHLASVWLCGPLSSSNRPHTGRLLIILQVKACCMIPLLWKIHHLV